MPSRESRVTSHALSRLVGMLLIIGLLLGATVHAATFKRGTLTIRQGSTRATLEVEVADTPESRAQGLMNRSSLAENAGMLFVFDSTGQWGFWMKNTLIPLSIAFIDAQWEIVDVKDMRVASDPQNGPFEIYSPAKSYQYALEVNQGFFRQKNITVGAKVVYTPK